MRARRTRRGVGVWLASAVAMAGLAALTPLAGAQAVERTPAPAAAQVTGQAAAQVTGRAAAQVTGRAADRPDTLAAARRAPATPLNRWVGERIAQARDQDWYRFVLPADTYGIVTLGDLPADYSLSLTTPSGALVAQSVTTGKAFEEIARPLRAGTYFVRVWSPKGAHSTTPYRLRLRTFGPGVQVLSMRTPGDGTLVTELLNTTSSWLCILQVRISYLDRSGRVIGGTDDGTMWNRLAPGQTAPAQLFVAHAPAGTTGYRLTFTLADAPAVKAPPALRAVVTRTTVTRSDPNTAYHRYTGVITSQDSRTFRDPMVVIRDYAPDGTLIDFGDYPADALRARGRASFRVDTTVRGPVSRTRVTATTASVISYVP